MGSVTVFNEGENTIETTLTGDISNKDVLAFIDTMVRLTLEHDCLSWIVDYSDAHYRLSTMEIFDLPKAVFRKMEALGERRFHIRRAIIRVQDVSDFAFLENVAANNSQNLKVFKDKAQARHWLSENPALGGAGRSDPGDGDGPG